MEVVYYFDSGLNLCPVKKYLELKSLVKDKKLRILAELDQKIEYVRQNEGRPTPPISEPLHNYNFFEIKTRKDRNVVIRVLYFRYKNFIVLLNAFEKFDNYHTTKEKKIVERYYNITEVYYQNFISNQNKYEKYE